VDYDFTAKEEEKFDIIAKGDLKWSEMIHEFYVPFHDLIMEGDKVPKIIRKLGIDPNTKKNVYARFTRFGPAIQLGESNGGKDSKPKFAPFPKDKTFETITLDDALLMLSLPRYIGKFKNETIEAAIGPRGPYIRCGKKYISIEEEEVFSITENEAIKLIQQSIAARENSIIKSFSGTQIIVKNGRFGPYVTDGKINAKIPKSIKPEDIDLKKSKELVESKKK
jgi:DNA topoisomerase-1